MRILALAYACEPTKGSEPGAGWMWSRLLARFGETTVITRSNNRSLIEAALPTTPEAANLRFEYVDLPKWARFWKRGQRGIRLYYLLWQLAALPRARHLHRAEGFDLMWHVTMANFWLGSVGALVGPRFVYGPIGGGVPSCLNVDIVGIKGMMYESGRAVARAIASRVNPLARKALHGATLILSNNEDTKARLHERDRAKTVVFPNVLLEGRPRSRQREPRDPPTALFAGRLLPWKGVSLAIRALELLPTWRLIVCGEGPDEPRLRRLSRDLGLDERVEFMGWVERDQLHRLMAEIATVFLFPSLHDEAPWVVAEAGAMGLPVVCLDRGGAPAIAGRDWAVPLADLESTSAGIALAIREAHDRTAQSTWDLDSRERDLITIMKAYGLNSDVEVVP